MRATNECDPCQKREGELLSAGKGSTRYISLPGGDSHRHAIRHQHRSPISLIHCQRVSEGRARDIDHIYLQEIGLLNNSGG